MTRSSCPPVPPCRGWDADDPVLADPRVLVYHRGPVDIGVLIVVLLVVVGFALVDLWRHR